MSLTENDLSRAAVILADHLCQLGVKYSISGGAARSLLRHAYAVRTRSTDDIDLVVQPDGNLDADAISTMLYKDFPAFFGTKTVYGVTVPTLILTQDGGSKINVDLEIFDVRAWPNRPQYDLSNPNNELLGVQVDGKPVIIFGPRWQLREKIVTAYERRGSVKEGSDLDDVRQLLELVGEPLLDMSQHVVAIRHILTRRPELREPLQLGVSCPGVLGEPET